MSTLTLDKNSQKTIFGFWIYIMTDCVLFASLFATFMILRNNTNSGPDSAELFSLPFVLTETLILLTSSFTCGLAMLAAHKGDKKRVGVWLAITFLLGLAFLSMELYEFGNLVAEGHDWQASAFLSAFFTLVGAHGLHITAGLIWILLHIVKILRSEINNVNLRRLTMLSLFWHFLDIVWIFIFTIVYMIGAL